jgi:tRNA (guanine37-N1)-methyltransferase
VRFDVISLFPEMFEAIRLGVTGRAFTRNLAELHLWNPRQYAADVHLTVDDRPYGGGPGMLMLAEPLAESITQARIAAGDSPVVYLSPQGRRFDQSLARELVKHPGLILICGRYEGIDQRVIDAKIDDEVSVGDFVVSGGEMPAMLVMDALLRLLPGVLGHQDSASQDSYSDGLLDFPQYTRPEVVFGQAVPRVLRSGDHEAIRRWRLKQALGRTWLRRPDLLESRPLSDEEQSLLNEFICGQSST